MLDEFCTRVPPENVVIRSTLGSSPAGTFALIPLDGIGDRLAVFVVQIVAPGDVAEGAQHSQIVVERSHLEERHGNARRFKARLEFRLVRIAAASARSARHDDEIGFERDDGLEVRCREVADLRHIGRFDRIALERIVGSADERSAGKLPRIRKAAHAGDHAFGVLHRHLGAGVVGKRIGLCRVLALSGIRFRSLILIRRLARRILRRAAEQSRGPEAEHDHRRQPRKKHLHIVSYSFHLRFPSVHRYRANQQRASHARSPPKRPHRSFPRASGRGRSTRPAP